MRRSPVALISAYDAEHGSSRTLRAAEIFDPVKPVKIRDPRSPSLSMIVAVVLLAVIGFGAYRLVSHHSDKSHPPKAAAAVSHRPSTSATPTVHPSPSPTPTRSDVVIQLTANEDCWVLLTRHSDGSQIFMGVVPAGSARTWTEKQAVDMRLGNPPGVVLIVDGKQHSTNVNNPETLSFSPQSS